MLVATLTPEAWTAIAAWVAVALAAAAGLVAFGQLRESRRLRREQAQPYVVVFLDENPSGPWIGDFVIKNYGVTAAYEVRLEASPRITTSLGESESKELLLPEVIPVLVPGQEWRTTWDSTVSRHGVGLPDRYSVAVKFQDSHGRTEQLKYVLDWEVYVQRGYTERHGVHELVKSVRKIEKVLERWREPLGGGLRVVARDGSVRDRRARDERDMRTLDHEISNATGRVQARLRARRCAKRVAMASRRSR